MYKQKYFQHLGDVFCLTGKEIQKDLMTTGAEWHPKSKTGVAQ